MVTSMLICNLKDLKSVHCPATDFLCDMVEIRILYISWKREEQKILQGNSCWHGMNCSLEVALFINNRHAR